MRNIVTSPTVLDTIKSNSNPNIQYEIRMGKDGVVYCTCRGWQMNKWCKHLDQWQQKLTNTVQSQTQATAYVRQSHDMKNDEVVLEFFEKSTNKAKGIRSVEQIIADGIGRGKW